MDPRASAIIDFWIETVGPEGWYRQDVDLDDQITEHFHHDYETARCGGYDPWMSRPRSCLALLILLDQFPRNMFRDCGDAFATDLKALRTAHLAIRLGHDARTDFPARQFFYLPFMHSETLAHQDRAVRLFAMNESGTGNLSHARAHRWVIRRFGRFPYRNAAMRRGTSAAEKAFLDAGGYSVAMRAVETQK